METEIPQESMPLVIDGNFSIQIREDQLKEMYEQRALFERFVSRQLKDQIDFGIIPGTKKPSLWKPGAEKIANLYMLGSRIIESKKDINVKDNYAIMSYVVEIFHIPSGKIIAQLEGMCSSLEKKYVEREVWEWDNRAGKKVSKGIHKTPVGDVLNTVAKMAQKRAFVGAIIIATKASDFFNHDLNEAEEEYFEQNGQPVEHKYEPTQPAKVTPIEKTMGAEAPKFQAPPIQADSVRAQLLNEINELRKSLDWTPPQMAKFISDNTGKTGAQMNVGELQLLVETLKKVRKQNG